ncbi:MAG: hypothetical protein ACR2OU_05640 [Thermomicrobiales bacterium]
MTPRERDLAEDDFLMDRYDSSQNGDSEESEVEPPDHEEFCNSCGELFVEAGDGYDGLCPACADAKERDEDEIR